MDDTPVLGRKAGPHRGAPDLQREERPRLHAQEGRAASRATGSGCGGPHCPAGGGPGRSGRSRPGPAARGRVTTGAAAAVGAVAGGSQQQDRPSGRWCAERPLRRACQCHVWLRPPRRSCSGDASVPQDGAGEVKAELQERGQALARRRPPRQGDGVATVQGCLFAPTAQDPAVHSRALRAVIREVEGARAVATTSTGGFASGLRQLLRPDLEVLAREHRAGLLSAHQRLEERLLEEAANAKRGQQRASGRTAVDKRAPLPCQAAQAHALGIDALERPEYRALSARWQRRGPPRGRQGQGRRRYERLLALRS
mmetsp:Transcript_135533/g.377450  ORF Transcript_135533/g.377450 Transcript_135533/m.377450 type:complete len:312 (+) Transcript_135533:93-1028(+)